MPSLTLEETALSALAQLGAHEPERATKYLDETGVKPIDFGPVASVAAAVETLLRGGRAPEVFAVAELAHVPQATAMRVLVSNDVAAWQPLRQQLEAVREKAKRRQLVATLKQAQLLLEDPTVDLGTAVSDCLSALQGATEARGIRKASDDLMKLIDDVERVHRGEKLPVLETGLPELDTIIGGLQPTLTVIGSMPGVGKSALLAAILESLARRGVVSGFLSLEDAGRAAVLRMVARAAQVPVFVLANRPLGAHQLERFGKAAEGLYTPLESVLVDDRAGLSTSEVVASARAMVTQGAKAIFVDHLGEIRLERSDRHDLDIAEALQQLRALAKTHSVPVVVLAHLKRREGADEEPRLTDFAFSAGVERMARVALGLTRPEPDVLRVHVLKQTQGAAGVVVNLNFDAPSGIVANGAPR